MIGYRHADARYPFLWERSDQPPARWHGRGEGPAHYFADSPDGAWAEFLRHEEITEVRDLETIRRALWIVELGDEPTALPELTEDILLGNEDTYPVCRAEAQRVRNQEINRLEAPSAALRPGGVVRWRVEAGEHPVPNDGKIFVLFGARPDLVGSLAAVGGPRADLLERVRYLSE